MKDSTAAVDPNIYRLIAEQTNEYALFVLDPEGRVMTWNRGARRINGYDADEIIGKHFSIFYPPESVARGWPAEELRIAAAEGHLEDEGSRLRKDGSRFWASVAITALRDPAGQLLGFSKIVRDLTERKQNEEALRLSEERFRLLVEGVVDYAIFMLDPAGIVSSWNAGAEQIKGYSRDEIVGKHFSQFYTPEDLAEGKPEKELEAARSTGRAEDEGWRVRKNGERFWARVVLTSLHDASGRLHGFAKVTQDLTERRHLADLEKSNRNLNEFIGMLAHELRNPLAPIRFAVNVLGRAPSPDPTHEAMRQMIDRQSAHLVVIVEDMVDIARVSRGKLSIEHAPVEIAEVIRRSVEAATPLIEAEKHKLDIDAPADSLHAHGDVNRMTQILTNLLNNAARYTPEGGNITLTARAENGWAVITVGDNGRGIEPQMLERIFDMFVQDRSPLQRVGGGLGLGLALARKLAELHGGTLTANSEGRNRGSEFTWRVPLSNRQRADNGKVAKAQDVPFKHRRILVVDDNVDAADALNLLLQSLGHETCVAYDGQASLRMAAEFRPDIVLLDIGMPGLNGFEVARSLSALKKERKFRIIAMTGWGQATDKERSREAGFDLHLVKPVDAKDLARVVNESNGATLH
jgi:PAS domain S-box-containing protein